MDPRSPKFNRNQHHQEIGLEDYSNIENAPFGTHCLSFRQIMFEGHEVVQLYISLITMWVFRSQSIAIQWFQSSFSHGSWSVIFYITVPCGDGGGGGGDCACVCGCIRMLVSSTKRALASTIIVGDTSAINMHAARTTIITENNLPEAYRYTNLPSVQL